MMPEGQGPSETTPPLPPTPSDPLAAPDSGLASSVESRPPTPGSPVPPSDYPPRPAISSEPIDVVLPIVNARAYLEKVVADWLACLNGLRRDFGLILVDDGSNDGTAALAAELADGNPRLQVLEHAAHQGWGAAVRTALAQARHPLICCAPGDLRYRPSDLARLLKWIDQADLVLGYRCGPDGRRARIRNRRAVRWLARWAFGVRLSDPACTFLLARRRIFSRIPIQSNGEFAQVEILAKANFLGCLMTETSITYHPPAESEDVPFRQMLREARRLYSHPDFGPAILPEGALPPIPALAECKESSARPASPGAV